MTYSIDTPFNTYQDIQYAMSTNQAILSYDRTTAYNIACQVNQWYGISNFIIPIVSMIAMFSVCQVFAITKWVLLFGIVALLLTALIPHIKSILIILAVAFIALPLFVFHNPNWMLAIGVGIIGMIIGYVLWWGFITSIAHRVLMNNEELFERVWKSGKIAIKTDNTIDGFYTYGCAEVREARKKYNL